MLAPPHGADLIRLSSTAILQEKQAAGLASSCRLTNILDQGSAFEGAQGRLWTFCTACNEARRLQRMLGHGGGGPLLRTNKIDDQELSKVIDRLGEAAVNPDAWRDIMDDICKAVGASAALLLQSDIRTPDVPRTESIDEGTQFYFRNN
ncbi:hypothetical protein [Bradyrhizobium sp. BR 1432]